MTDEEILQLLYDETLVGNAPAVRDGVNDGLGSIFGIVSGVSGATLGNSHFVLIAGLAGMAASALSMGSGAYLAAKSEREIYEAELHREREALRANPDDWETAEALLASFDTEMSEAGIGTISEIFDADSPFTARGCIAQAWSVAEVLRCELSLRAGRQS